MVSILTGNKFDPNQDIPDLSGKVYIITGGTAGIGFGITAHILQHHPAKIIILSQKEEHADEAIEELKNYGDTAKVHWIQLDLKDLKQTDGVAKQVQSEKQIDAVGNPVTSLILNAGEGVGSYNETVDGLGNAYLPCGLPRCLPVLDSHFQVNHLSQFHLAMMLWPNLQATPNSRLVLQSSDFHNFCPSSTTFTSVPEINTDIGPLNLYARTKLAQILHVRAMTRRMNENQPGFQSPKATGPWILAVHPGGVQTDQPEQAIEPYGMIGKIGVKAIKPFLKDPLDKGCRPALFAATSEDIVKEKIQGEYVHLLSAIGAFMFPVSEVIRELEYVAASVDQPLTRTANTMFDSLPVSGIHRLFTGASSQSSQSYRPQLESVTEESHTYDLLYPDFHALQQSQDQIYPLRAGSFSPTASDASSFDDRGGLDIQSPRDVRILVAQDGIALQQGKVLYDSHPPLPFPASRMGSTDSRGALTSWAQHPTGVPRKTQTFTEAPTPSRHVRHVSLNEPSYTSPLGQRSPLPPAPESRGPFGNPRPRRTVTRPVTSEGETHQSKIAKEGREEVEALLGCMFGSTGLPLMSGTKLHIRPSATAEALASSQSDMSLASPELASFHPARRRRTPLTRSTTADEVHFLSSSAPNERLDPSQMRSKGSTILVTRLFTVDPPESLSPRANLNQTCIPHEEPEVEPQAFRFPSQPSTVSDTAGAKQFKYPTYALSLMLRLSPTIERGQTSIPQMTSPVSPDASEPCRSAGDGQWREAGFHGCNDTDRDVEQIIDRWNVLTRLLCSLEKVVQARIQGLLTEISALQLQPTAPASGAASTDSNDPTKSPVKRSRLSNQRTIHLQADALQNNDEVRKATCVLGQRVALVLRTRRVITGQGRWGVWREEARWVGRWAGSREQDFFFFNLLTVFLGSHTEWVDSLDGVRASRFRTKGGRGRRPESTTRQQTVIVSSDKMAARRLIFLLSAFLPSTAPHESIHAPLRMRSRASFSESPPSGVPLVREQSLRRTINRRRRGARGPQGSRIVHGRSLSFAGHENDNPGTEEHHSQERGTQHARRTSNAASIRSLAPPISNSGEDSTRKGSTTTTSTIVPDATVPVAHFSNVARDPLMGTTPTPRPGSSGSLASLSLQRTLSRSQSNEHSNASVGSRSFSRWGSMVSGFWSSRRGSMTEDSESMSPPTEGLGISGVSKMPGQSSSSSTGPLAKMVEETESMNLADQHETPLEPSPQAFSSPDTLRESSSEAIGTEVEGQATKARAIPERPPVESFPVKLSVGDGEGVIDVQLPSSDSYSSSFESSIGSVGASHTAASSFNERSSIFTRSPSKDRSTTPFGSPVEVAGWLKEYSPEFALQAVKPYAGMKDDVEKAMAAHSTTPGSLRRGHVDDKANEGWKDVRTSLIADTTNFSITRLSFQRRALTKKKSSANLSTLFGSAMTEQVHEERVVEEAITDRDPMLINVVERVLAQSGHSSRKQSRAPSRAASHRDLRAMPPSHMAPADHGLMLEVPKSECKKLVLGALEQVVRSVQAEQEVRGDGEKGRRIGASPVRKDGDEDFPPDSTLREGVRRWLKDTGAVPAS
ncbi:MAG: hypothetical protein Q9194_005627 [Teloschistes cf. exilis]